MSRAPAGQAILCCVLTESPRLVQQYEQQAGAAGTLVQALGTSSSIMQVFVSV